jgi:hypothetical protein
MTTPSNIIQQAAEKLSAQADRYMKAAHSLTKTALRLATIDEPTKVLQALAKYRQASLPEPELMAEIEEMIEGTQSPEWREAAEKRRKRALHYRLQRDGNESEALPDLPPEMVLRVARERSDVLGAAVDAIERRGDHDGEIQRMLSLYISGRLGLAAVEGALSAAGISPGQSNVVSFPVRRGQS